MNKVRNVLETIFIILALICIFFMSVKVAKSDDDKWGVNDKSAQSTAVKNHTRGVSFILQMCSNKAKAQKKFWKRTFKDAPVWNAGWLYGNTSNPNGCRWSGEFMKQPAKKRVRIHICNSTCYRSGRKCTKNECFEGLSESAAIKAIKGNNQKVYKRIDGIIDLAIKDYKQAPKGTVIDYAVSSCLECFTDSDARKKLNEYVKNKFKPLVELRKKEKLNDIQWVDNPVSGGCLDGYLCEKHGTPDVGKQGIADNDGEDYDLIAQKKYWSKNQDAWMAFAWKPCLNGSADVAGTTGNGKKFIPAYDRTGWCDINREAPEFNIFTGQNIEFTESRVSQSGLENNDKGCSKFHNVDDEKMFVWKVSDKGKWTTWVAPATYGKFSKVFLMCDGKQVDSSYARAGYRFGSEYTHDQGNKKRKIYDFTKSMWDYGTSGKCTLHGDGHCWKFDARFRPTKK